jgi:hypothetical protein
VVIAFKDVVVDTVSLKLLNVNEETKVLLTPPAATKYTRMMSKVLGSRRDRLRLTGQKGSQGEGELSSRKGHAPVKAAAPGPSL